jgi:A/G-specific adenine glycosylase
LFTKTLINWYSNNKRELPWRGESDPYKVWISEIILQQTRISQGWQYYLRFIDRFPNVQTLAQASEDEVLKYWQGLGYYSRARNLHVGAKYIYSQCGGIFPDEYHNILKIKGVGEYTAAAIASFCFRLPYPAIDGNALRVLSRVFDIQTPIDTTTGKKEILTIATKLIDNQAPDIFNQAIMDFGSLQCTPTNPKCDDCCLMCICRAYALKKQHLLPAKSKTIQIRQRFFYYFCIIYQNTTYLRKRPPKDIWQGLYEFPLLETKTQLSEKEIIESTYFNHLLNSCQWTIENITPLSKHQLTHQLIHYQFITIKITKGKPHIDTLFSAINLDKIDNYPVAKITEEFLVRV